MASVDITQKTIAKAKRDARPGAGRYDLSDARAQGLNLRVGARGAVWQYRFKKTGKYHRINIGSVDEWSIAEARQIASDAAAMLRNGYGIDDEWVHQQRVKHGKIVETRDRPDNRALLKWNLETGIKKYLEEVQRTRKPATFDDYRKMLATPELQPYLRSPLPSISRQNMAEVVASVHKRGVERHAEHLASVLRPLWGFLERDDVIRNTGVTPGEMRGLAAPGRSLIGHHEKRKSKYVPAMVEVGRILAIARSGAFNQTTSAALQLLVFTCQRITPIAAAKRDEFRKYGAIGGIWSMPAMHRKTAIRRGDLADHVIPLPRVPWSVISRQLENDTEYVFPAARPRRVGDVPGAMANTNLSHALRYMPGVEATPHDLRRSFGTHGQKKFGWGREGTKLILDHNEGIESGDVTAESYDLDHRIEEKLDIMKNWASWVEEHMEMAIEDDVRLADLDWLRSEIKKARDQDKKKKG